MKDKSEFQEQCEVFSWARNPMVLKKYPMLELMFAINNGLKLTIGQAVKAKRSGTLKGMLDFMLAHPKKSKDGLSFSCCGLFVEMKKKGGKLSPEQKDKIEKLINAGYRCYVCYSSKEAIDCIEEYLK